MTTDHMRGAGGPTSKRQIDLTVGTIEYQDTGGDDPPIVLLHGLLRDASIWDEVIAGLAADHRCIAPTLLLGANRHPMRADADLSLPGIARLVAELLDRKQAQSLDGHPRIKRIPMPLRERASVRSVAGRPRNRATVRSQ
jgi:hypothetical protein